MHEGNPIPEFLSSEGYIRLSPKAQASSGALFRVYRLWCDDNATPSFSQKSFCASVKQLASQYGLQYTNKIPLSDGRIVRGFTGISVLLPGFGK
jgi:putative DNA primase/helicase